MVASHVYVRAWALGCFQSYQYPNLSEGADRVGGQLRGDKECPFCGVTKAGRVWRKVPENGALSVACGMPRVCLRQLTCVLFWIICPPVCRSVCLVAVVVVVVVVVVIVVAVVVVAAGSMSNCKSSSSTGTSRSMKTCTWNSLYGQDLALYKYIYYYY